jgi:hypothetical protein
LLRHGAELAVRRLLSRAQRIEGDSNLQRAKAEPRARWFFGS